MNERFAIPNLDEELYPSLCISKNIQNTYSIIYKYNYKDHPFNSSFNGFVIDTLISDEKLDKSTTFSTQLSWIGFLNDDLCPDLLIRTFNGKKYIFHLILTGTADCRHLSSINRIKK